MSEKLELRSVYDLLGEHFFIPSYQRGYRWTKQQVEDLLDDLLIFSKKDKQKDEFYCLQPVVVKNRSDGNGWEVIDGQQRLTTIGILISFLCRKFEVDEFKQEYHKDQYSISYETREKSQEFLLNIVSHHDDKTNPDFYYMSEAYSTIERWYLEKKLIRSDREGLLSTILNTEQCCKVIWYQVDENSSGPELFTRLNIGKIPLTNSELVKALFLSKDVKHISEPNKVEIALLWDEMERQLSDKDFWAFITNKKREKYPNRIELLFDIIAKKNDSKDDFFTFHYFFKKLDTKKNELNEAGPWNEWLEIEQCYQTLREWYKDKDLYHWIGYLVSIDNANDDKVVSDLLKDAKDKPKSQFKSELVDKIRQSLGMKSFQIKELKYHDDNMLLSKLLLLFNVETVRKTKERMAKYPFHSSKSEGEWSLEHIHAQASESLNQKHKPDWAEWFKEHAKLLKTLAAPKADEVLKNVNHFLKSKLKNYESWEKLDENAFQSMKYEDFDNRIYKPIIAFFTQDGGNDEIHEIENLALLKSHVNSSLSNAVFAVKRQRIIDWDRNGAYIPICTKNVFLKYYTEDTSNSQVIFWGPQDRANYLKAIETTLEIYLPKQDEKESVS